MIKHAVEFILSVISSRVGDMKAEFCARSLLFQISYLPLDYKSNFIIVDL